MRAWAVIRVDRRPEPPPVSGTTDLTALEILDDAVLGDPAALGDSELIQVDPKALARALHGAVRAPTRAWVQARHVVGVIVEDEAGPGPGGPA
jgi:hypothetical protein